MKKVTFPIVDVLFNNLITTPNDFHGGQDEACLIIQQQLEAVLDNTSFHFNGRDKNVCCVSFWVSRTDFILYY